MSKSHLLRVRELGGDAKAHLLGEYAGLSGADAELNDPYGGDLASYRDTYRSLAAIMPALVGRIAATAR
jgi:hypothetical protein